MPHQISPLGRSLYFSFKGNECLYRGFEGERVLVDAEGPGVLRVIRSEPALTYVRDGETTKEFPPLFRDTLTVNTSATGVVEAEICFELPVDATESELIEVENRYCGAGWLIRSSGRCQIDGRHEWIETMQSRSPVPIFSTLEGEGKFTILRDSSSILVLADAWDIDDSPALAQRGWTVQNMSKLRELASTFPDGTPRTAQIASHLNAAQWTSPIPENNRGLILRRTFDRFHGRQRARVHVDGKLVGVWYEPSEDRLNRWAVSDLGIPADATAGKTSITITIDPPSGVSLWSVSRMEIWALTDAKRF